MQFTTPRYQRPYATICIKTDPDNANAAQRGEIMVFPLETSLFLMKTGYARILTAEERKDRKKQQLGTSTNPEMVNHGE